jgi:hypothetical protein
MDRKAPKNRTCPFDKKPCSAPGRECEISFDDGEGVVVLFRCERYLRWES